ncbi:MAG: calcium-binding protein, partial [Caulobacteraceae bacterium]
MWPISIRPWSGTIDNRGEIIIQYSGSEGVALDVTAATTHVSNSGSISVDADYAFGYRSEGLGAFNNSGELDVRGGFYAVGVDNVLATAFRNTGSIYAGAADGATAVRVVQTAGTQFNNDGMIRATASDSFSVGVAISGQAGDTSEYSFFANHGTIDADVAIVSSDSGVVLRNHVTNTGTIIGDIRLGGSFDVFVNLGHVAGDIVMGDGRDEVDLANAIETTGEIFLGADDDACTLGTSGQTVWAGTGNDAVGGGAGDDILHGEDGDDRLSGGDGNDLLYGEAGADLLRGGSGNDRLNGGSGADDMAGGSGNDVYYVDNRGDRAVESAASGGADKVYSSVSFTLGDFVENLSLTGSVDAYARGNDLDNVLNGNNGANKINGGAVVAVQHVVQVVAPRIG